MSAAGPAPYDISQDFGPLWDQGIKGAGVRVAVLDTGADEQVYEYARQLSQDSAKNPPPPTFWDDPEWRGVTIKHRTVPSGQLERLWPKGPPPSVGVLSHGGKVTRRVLMGAQNAHVIDMRVFTPDCSDDDLVKSIEDAVQLGADVVNLSLGHPIAWAEAEAHLRTCPIARATSRLAQENDTIFVAAAGNWGKQAFGCPAFSEFVYAVGASLSRAESAYYHQYPDQQLKDFLDNRHSTSYATGLASAQIALLRSAFPGLGALSLISILSAASGNLAGFPRSDHVPLGTTYLGKVFEYIREIVGGDYFGNGDWLRLLNLGIYSRRDLLDAPLSRSSHPWLRQFKDAADIQRERGSRFERGVVNLVEGRHHGDSLSTLAKSIEHFRQSATDFKDLGLEWMEAVVDLNLGAALCNHAWKAQPGRIIIEVAQDSTEVLTRTVKIAQASKRSGMRELLGTALSWRARATILVAELDLRMVASALTDAKQSIEILRGLEQDNSTRHDLGQAYVHLARVYFFRGHSPAAKADDFDMAHSLATNALAYNDDIDGAIRTDAEWLIAHSA